jgi:hypothetical protein
VEESESVRALTSWRVQRERCVKSAKEDEQARGTHFLESAEGAMHQVSERGQASQEHSLPEEPREGQDSKMKPASKGSSPTGERRGRDKSRHEEKLASESHSLSGEHRGRDKSGQRKRPTDRGHSLARERKGNNKL